MGMTRRRFLGCAAGAVTMGLRGPRGVAVGLWRLGRLRDYLQVRIEAPVQLWSARVSSQCIPYVDYTWPRPAKVRDFSRVVPLGRQAGEVIAWVDDLPVALKRQSGRGRLIVLGSPLGPALWAGDAEARRWLFDCIGAAGGGAESTIS